MQHIGNYPTNRHKEGKKLLEINMQQRSILLMNLLQKSSESWRQEEVISEDSSVLLTTFEWKMEDPSTSAK